MELTDVKNYLRVDTDVDDALITTLLSAADTYIRRTTGKNYARDGDGYIDIAQEKLFGLLELQLVAHWYEHRGGVSDGSVQSLPHAVDFMLDKITNGSDYVESNETSETTEEGG